MDGRELELQPVSFGSRDTPASKGTLCDKCLAISWKPDKSFYRCTLDHYERFSDLEASSEAGCLLCQTFFLLLTYDGLGSGKSDPLHWELTCDYDLWSLRFETQKLGRVNERWEMHDAGSPRPSHAVTAVKGFTASDLTNDLCALLDESIKPWLEACLCPRAHMNCPNLPPNEELSYRMPTRLIYVGSERQPTAKLIASEDLSEGDRKSPYLVLSYRWGKGNDFARTTTKNLEERKNEIMFQYMPKTVRDAMDITRLMGIQYLWVDAICIIQADKSLGSQQDDVARADWEKESMNMAAYYANALCCIAAASAKDSSEGFLIERQVARYGYKKWQSPANVFVPSPHATRRRFRSSLLSRGWCLQEWLLSTRILHWTSNGLIWQCSHGFFWEGQSGFQGETQERFCYRKTNDCLLDLGVPGIKTEDICKILLCNDKNTVGKTWTQLVSQFTRMGLSFTTDRLAAIQGIATNLSDRHGLEYFAGVFRSHCAMHLMWVSESPRTSLEGINTFPTCTFPTWSWASSRGYIYFFGTSGTGTFLIRDLQRFPSADEQSNVLNPAKKELRFTAPLMKLSDFEWEGAEGESQGESTEGENTFGTLPQHGQYLFSLGSLLWGGLNCIINIDILATSLPFIDDAYLLVLRYTEYEYQGLVVQKAKMENRVDLRDNTNVYERIGMFYTLDYTGIGMVYTGDSAADIADTISWETKVILI